MESGGKHLMPQKIIFDVVSTHKASDDTTISSSASRAQPVTTAQLECAPKSCL